MMILEQHRIPETIELDRIRLEELRSVLRRYCLSLTRSSYGADDLAQETWAKALGYRKFTGSPNPEALLLRIAKNTWIDAARRQNGLIHALERSGTAPDPASEAAMPGDLGDMELTFQALINHLSPLQRTAFVLRDVLGYSAAEAAVCLGTTEGAVKAALHRARLALAKVREELAEHEGPALPQNADYRAYLRALAHAYEQGQIPVMLELLRQDNAGNVTAAVSTHSIQAVYSDNVRYSYSYGSPATYELRMAA
ncbi:RNA polymerase sigma factor [Paenibacillus tritici]|uniref:RNA polymerase sigma factor n=1 Tax=Paenibacillus tritici TaxID=1873425 RepID=UPI001BA786ED|nr:RNA polymerase sigma factor [Paenibacillus tritici]QUL56858.1 RNA polymerase sigma factor [Paenibacillus tritici]